MIIQKTYEKLPSTLKTAIELDSPYSYYSNFINKFEKPKNISSIIFQPDDFKSVSSRVPLKFDIFYKDGLSISTNYRFYFVKYNTFLPISIACNNEIIPINYYNDKLIPFCCIFGNSKFFQNPEFKTEIDNQVKIQIGYLVSRLYQLYFNTMFTNPNLNFYFYSKLSITESLISKLKPIMMLEHIFTINFIPNKNLSKIYQKSFTLI